MWKKRSYERKQRATSKRNRGHVRCSL